MGHIVISHNKKWKVNNTKSQIFTCNFFFYFLTNSKNLPAFEALKTLPLKKSLLRFPFNDMPRI
jgi:hypothetical protein